MPRACLSTRLPYRSKRAFRYGGWLLAATLSLNGALAAADSAQLAARLTFDDETAHDALGQLPGEFQGPAAFAAGQVGPRAWQTNGETGLRLPAWDFGERFSLVMWVKPRAHATSLVLAATSPGGYAAAGWRFFINSFGTGDGKLLFESGDGQSGATAATAAGRIVPDRWQQVAVVVDRVARTAHLYVDGTERTERNAVHAFPPRVKEWTLGRLNDGYEPTRFQGEIDDVRLYAGLLSPQAIKALAAETGGPAVTALPAPDPARLEAAKFAPPYIDRYGQPNTEDWPEKIHSDQQLVEAAAAEEAALGDQTPLPAAGHDAFGGDPRAGQFAATGFFRFEKVAGRWWLITPAGHLFYLQGVDGVNFSFYGSGTPLKNPDGSPRRVFAELPDRETYPIAYARKGHVNFFAANLQRKYGTEYRQRWADLTNRRLAAWGFNCAGQWWIEPEMKLPYLWDLNAWKCPVIKGKKFNWPDPFAAEFVPALADINAQLERRRDDPYLIGWVFQNENGWNRETVAELQVTSESVPARQALRVFLIEKQGEARAAEWLPAVAETEKRLAPPAIPPDLTDEFIFLASTKYHAAVAEYFRRQDPHHLFLGPAHCGHQSIEWIIGGAAACDALLLHDYSLNMNWIGGHLPRLEKTDKPLLVTEFSFVTAGRGLRSYGDTTTVGSQADRGRCYRYFVERLAAHPQFAGFSWFGLSDECIGGKEVDGENHNFGLISQADQPYREMIAEMKKTNARVFAIHRGEVAPQTLEQLGLLRKTSTLGGADALEIPHAAADGRGAVIVPPLGASVAAADLSARIELTWDEAGLNLEAKVVDDDWRNAYADDEIWRGDAVELWFNDTQFGFAGHSAGGAPRVHCWKKSAPAPDLRAVKVEFATVDFSADPDFAAEFAAGAPRPGWRLKAKLPWSTLGLEAQPGREAQLAVGIDDADRPDNRRQTFFPFGYAYGAPETFQKIRLQ